MSRCRSNCCYPSNCCSPYAYNQYYCYPANFSNSGCGCNSFGNGCNSFGGGCNNFGGSWWIIIALLLFNGNNRGCNRGGWFF